MNVRLGNDVYRLEVAHFAAATPGDADAGEVEVGDVVKCAEGDMSLDAFLSDVADYHRVTVAEAREKLDDVVYAAVLAETENY